MQNVAEFWNVSTRPKEKNGLGLTVAQVALEVCHIEAYLTILPDTPAVYQEWKRLVTTHEVRGVQVHDARIAAAMRVRGIQNLLTLNGTDFKRYPDIRSMAPSAVLAD